ncbi:MAG TPA: LysR family transcriptional regulator [Thermohalobaculum sp.]|nr:LysR family transcriptional regulator [Thermohalobaculum sp.]
MHQIRYFLAVSQHLNFTKAAEACHVAQPSLTRAIKKLEEELGGELFRRERRATHPTELGRMMLPLLSACYDGAQTAKTLAGSYATGDHAPLSLAISRSVNLAHFVGPFAELTRAMPGLSLSFFRGPGDEVGERLKSGEAELAIAGPFAVSWERLNEWPLFTETFALVAHRDHPLAQRDQIDPGALAGERLLARPYCGSHERLMTALSEHGVDGLAVHTMATEDDMVALLEANAGVAFLPRTARRPDGARTIEITGLGLERTVRLYDVAGRRRSPAASGLIKLLRSADLLDEAA